MDEKSKGKAARPAKKAAPSKAGAAPPSSPSGSVGRFRFGGYLAERKREGRFMAESTNQRLSEDVAGGDQIFLTEEDEAILDRIWDRYPVTDEERRRKEEFEKTIRPGTRQKRPDGKD